MFQVEFSFQNSFKVTYVNHEQLHISAKTTDKAIEILTTNV